MPTSTKPDYVLVEDGESTNVPFDLLGHGFSEASKEISYNLTPFRDKGAVEHLVAFGFDDEDRGGDDALNHLYSWVVDAGRILDEASEWILAKGSDLGKDVHYVAPPTEEEAAEILAGLLGVDSTDFAGMLEGFKAF